MKILQRKATRIKVCIYTIFIIIIIIAAAVVFLMKASPVFIQTATRIALSEINGIISKKSGDVLRDFEDNLRECSVNDIEEATLVSVNTSELNAIRHKLHQEIVNELDELSDNYIYIPFGSIFKNVLIQGSGIKVPVKVCYTTVPEVAVDSSVTSCGINQVKYTVKFVVTVNVSIISAYICENAAVKIDVPVYEKIIIGKIPSYYTQRN